jgi:hypothetical protein
LAQEIVDTKGKFFLSISLGGNAYHIHTFLTITDTRIEMTIDQAFPQGEANIRFTVQTSQHTNFVQAFVTAPLVRCSPIVVIPGSTSYPPSYGNNSAMW